MTFIYKHILVLVLFLSSFQEICQASVFVAAAPEPSVDRPICVLNFLPRDARIAHAVARTFAHVPEAIVIGEAQPTDLLYCLKLHSAEIILVAHTFEIAPHVEGQPQQFRLGYFQRKPDPHEPGRFQYCPRVFLDHIFEVFEEQLSAQVRNRSARLQKFA